MQKMHSLAESQPPPPPQWASQDVSGAPQGLEHPLGAMGLELGPHITDVDVQQVFLSPLRLPSHLAQNTFAGEGRVAVAHQKGQQFMLPPGQIDAFTRNGHIPAAQVNLQGATRSRRVEGETAEVGGASPAGAGFFRSAGRWPTGSAVDPEAVSCSPPPRRAVQPGG